MKVFIGISVVLLLAIEAYTTDLNVEASVYTLGGNSSSDENSQISGPVSAVMEDLAFNTASITDEMHLQLSTKIARTTNTLLGNIEVIIASAMDQLSDPIFQANSKLNSDKCQPLWTMDELLGRVESQLGNCTQYLSDIMETFQLDALLISDSIQSYVDDIANLPVVCQILSAEVSFANSSNCFVQKMAEINSSVSEQLNRISMTLVHTRKLSRSSVLSAQQCTSDLVAEVVQYLDNELADC